MKAILDAYTIFPGLTRQRSLLNRLVDYFKESVNQLPLTAGGLEVPLSQTAIQAVIVPGNEKVRMLSRALWEAGLDVRPILYPTIPKGRERLRVVIHSFNTMDEISQLVQAIAIHQ